KLSDSLERDDFSSNHHPALPLCLSMIFSRKPVSTFRDHALVERDLSLPDHRLPFFHFSNEQSGQLFRRRANGYHTDVTEMRLDSWIAQGGDRINVDSVDDRCRCPRRNEKGEPSRPRETGAPPPPQRWAAPVPIDCAWRWPLKVREPDRF